MEQTRYVCPEFAADLRALMTGEGLSEVQVYTVSAVVDRANKVVEVSTTITVVSPDNNPEEASDG